MRIEFIQDHFAHIKGIGRVKYPVGGLYDFADREAEALIECGVAIDPDNPPLQEPEPVDAADLEVAADVVSEIGLPPDAEEPEVSNG
jgi:hypothetical protein